MKLFSMMMMTQIISISQAQLVQYDQIGSNSFYIKGEMMNFNDPFQYNDFEDQVAYFSPTDEPFLESTQQEINYDPDKLSNDQDKTYMIDQSNPTDVQQNEDMTNIDNVSNTSSEVIQIDINALDKESNLQDKEQGEQLVNEALTSKELMETTIVSSSQNLDEHKQAFTPEVQVIQDFQQFDVLKNNDEIKSSDLQNQVGNIDQVSVLNEYAKESDNNQLNKIDEEQQNENGKVNQMENKQLSSNDLDLNDSQLSSINPTNSSFLEKQLDIKVIKIETELITEDVNLVEQASVVMNQGSQDLESIRDLKVDKIISEKENVQAIIQLDEQKNLNGQNQLSALENQQDTFKLFSFTENISKEDDKNNNVEHQIPSIQDGSFKAESMQVSMDKSSEIGIQDQETSQSLVSPKINDQLDQTITRDLLQQPKNDEQAIIFTPQNDEVQKETQQESTLGVSLDEFNVQEDDQDFVVFSQDQNIENQFEVKIPDELQQLDNKYVADQLNKLKENQNQKIEETTQIKLQNESVDSIVQNNDNELKGQENQNFVSNLQQQPIDLQDKIFEQEKSLSIPSDISTVQQQDSNSMLEEQLLDINKQQDEQTYQNRQISQDIKNYKPEFNDYTDKQLESTIQRHESMSKVVQMNPDISRVRVHLQDSDSMFEDQLDLNQHQDEQMGQSRQMAKDMKNQNTKFDHYIDKILEPTKVIQIHEEVQTVQQMNEQKQTLINQKKKEIQQQLQSVGKDRKKQSNSYINLQTHKSEEDLAERAYQYEAAFQGWIMDTGQQRRTSFVQVSPTEPQSKKKKRNLRHDHHERVQNDSLNGQQHKRSFLKL